MEIKKTILEEPQHGFNVLVKYNCIQQDFWTRGFLVGEEWTVMTWKGKVKVKKNDIEEWCYLPMKNNYRRINNGTT